MLKLQEASLCGTAMPHQLWPGCACLLGADQLILHAARVYLPVYMRCNTLLSQFAIPAANGLLMHAHTLKCCLCGLCKGPP